MTSCSSEFGSNSRNRQTPLSSTGNPVVRRSRQSALSSAGCGGPPLHPRYTISNRSPQMAQRKFCSTFSTSVLHPMHRSCDTWKEFDFDEVLSVIRIDASGRLVSANLLPTAQVLIRLADPVGARRIEYVEVHRILHRLRFVWHVRRNSQHVAGSHDDLFAIDPKL